MIYFGDADEREYLRRLAKTYAIFFMLRQDPAIVRYFADMTSGLRLYVGTDLLIQALSEHYLPEENRSATLMLQMAGAAGAELILAESVREEIIGNLRGADHEYHNYYEKIEHRLTGSYTLVCDEPTNPDVGPELSDDAANLSIPTFATA